MIFGEGEVVIEKEKSMKKFVEASVKYGEAIECGNSQKANRQSKIIREIRKQLNETKELEILIPLLEHNNNYVKLNAASSLIMELPNKSIQVLEQLQNKKGLFALEAQMFLKEWQKGNIKI